MARKANSTVKPCSDKEESQDDLTKENLLNKMTFCDQIQLMDTFLVQFV